MTDAFHQATITNEAPGTVIDNLMTLLVKSSGHELFGYGHTHRIGKALTKGPCGGFNARGITVLGVPRRLAMQLTEVFDVLHRQVKTCEMQQRINQHRPVPV